MEKGVPIRSLSRGLVVLQAINRGGALTMMDIARASEVPYPTACRIVQTLLHEGLIEQEPVRKRYRPTNLVQTLACGFQGDAALIQLARPSLVEFTRTHLWPVSLAAPVGASMVIRDSTHSLTTLTFSRYFPGYTLPLLECASGLVYLAHLEEEARQDILHSLKLLPEQLPPHLLNFIERDTLMADIRRAGYASRTLNRFTQTPGKTSSIAVPIFDGDQVAASLTMIFFSSAMRLQDAVDRYLSPLRRAADDISGKLTGGTLETVAA